MIIYKSMLIHDHPELNPASAIPTAEGGTPLEYGLSKFTAALGGAGIRAYQAPIADFDPANGLQCAVLHEHTPQMKPESFRIDVRGKAVHVCAGDAAGMMYALLDLAETVELYSYDAVKSRECEAFLAKRGVKFNLPYEPYGLNDPFEKNADLCMSRAFWQAYIDQLADNRYNVLSLWSMNPFERMFRIAKYPLTTPFSDRELVRMEDLWHFVFRYARQRCISAYVITWNLRITPAVARGLGLPEELASDRDSMNARYLRQYSEPIRDYFREAVKTLLYTYPELAGVGTSNSEEVAGDPEEAERFVADTYLRALNETNAHVECIHRTNCSNANIAKRMFLDQYKGGQKYISWKYSNAHMYSHPRPQFERVWDAWMDVDFMDGETQILYTVRNDDFYALRGGDAPFISSYFRHMKRPYVAGYYWGADGYLWGRDFQHVSHKHLEWKYDFEKNWYQFATLGRLGYDPSLDESYWIRRFEKRYGTVGRAFYRGLTAGTRMLAAVNRLHFINYDFEWHPESLLSNRDGFKTVAECMDCPAMPGVGTLSIREYAEGKQPAVEPYEGCPALETPDDVIGDIGGCIAELEDAHKAIRALPADEYAGEAECVACDVSAWLSLAKYYRAKLSAALLLARYRAGGGEALKAEAVSLLKGAVGDWKELAATVSGHYLPFVMGRQHNVFGYSYYVNDVEKDVAIARRIRPAEAPAD